jgi:hypothetical protein
MPIVEINGQEIEFPDDMSQDAIKSVLQKKFPVSEQDALNSNLKNFLASAPQSTQTPVVAPTKSTSQEPGFIDNVTADLQKRIAQQGVINEATATNPIEGQQNPLRGTLQTIGNVAGGMNDIIGQGVSSLVKTGFEQLSPETQQAVSDYTTRLKSTPLGQTISKGVQSYGENQAAFDQANPALGRDLSAVREIGTFFIPGGSGTVIKSVPDIAKAGVMLSKVPFRVAGKVGEGANLIVRDMAGIEKRVPIKTADDIKTIAAVYFKNAEEKGGVLKPDFTNKFIDSVKSLDQQSAEGKLFTGDTPFTEAMKRVELLRDKPITLKGAQEIDEALGDLIDNYTENGKLKKQGKKLLDIQNEFRSGIENATPDMIEGGTGGFDSWKQGKDMWAASMRMDDIERIISRAEGTNNPATSLRSGFNTLYNNKARMRGYTPKEAALIKRAAQSGVVSDTLRSVLGSRLVPIITGASGGGLGATAAAQASSMAARGIAARGQLGRAGDIAREISKRVKTGE